jgi:hypothetical protein
MAHNLNRLVLLHSCSDTVHSRLLHKTLLSTFLTMTSPQKPDSRPTFGPTVADCRCRAPLAPRLAQLYDYTLFCPYLQGFFNLLNKNFGEKCRNGKSNHNDKRRYCNGDKSIIANVFCYGAYLFRRFNFYAAL